MVASTKSMLLYPKEALALNTSTPIFSALSTGREVGTGMFCKGVSLGTLKTHRL